MLEPHDLAVEARLSRLETTLVTKEKVDADRHKLLLDRLDHLCTLHATTDKLARKNSETLSRVAWLFRQTRWLAPLGALALGAIEAVPRLGDHARALFKSISRG